MIRVSMVKQTHYGLEVFFGINEIRAKNFYAAVLRIAEWCEIQWDRSTYDGLEWSLATFPKHTGFNVYVQTEAMYVDARLRWHGVATTPSLLNG